MTDGFPQSMYAFRPLLAALLTSAAIGIAMWYAIALAHHLLDF
jgi:hypothetical protein